MKGAYSRSCKRKGISTGVIGVEMKGAYSDFLEIDSEGMV